MRAAPSDEADAWAEARSMRAAAIKKALVAAGVPCADLFEKEELAERYVRFKLGQIAPVQAQEPVKQQEDVQPTGGQPAQRNSDLVIKCKAMSAKELRTELGTRGIPWADALEKDELVNRLVEVLAKEKSYCTSGRIRPGIVASLTGAELSEELKDGTTPVLLDVYATWCGPCQLMAPQLEAAAKRLASRIRVAKMDSDKEQAMATQLRVGALPTIIIFDRNGKEVKRQEGALMEDQLLALVNAAGV